MRVLVVGGDEFAASIKNDLRQRRFTLLHKEQLPPSRSPLWSKADVIVIEPQALNQRQVARLYVLLERYPLLSVLLAGPLDRPLVTTVNHVAPLARVRFLNVVLPHDPLQSIVLRTYAATIPDRVVEGLSAELALMPEVYREDMRDTLRRLFRHPEDFAIMDDFAKIAGVSRKTLYRIFEHTKIGNPKELVRAAKITASLPHFYTWQPLVAVAQKNGFPRYLRFQRECERFFGAQPRLIRFRTNPARIPDNIVRALLHPAQFFWRDNPAP